MKEFCLTDLISVEALQKIQDGFSEYTGMAALTTDSEGVPVTKGSGFTKFCMELTRKSIEGCRACEECDKNGAFLALKNKCVSVYDCHAGLTDFAAPIMLEGKVIGSFIGGQVRTAPVCEEKLRETAVRYKINPDEYVEAAGSTKCLSKEEVKKAADYLAQIAEGLSEMAYKHYLSLQESEHAESVARTQAEFVMNRGLLIKNSMERWIDLMEREVEKHDEKAEVFETVLANASDIYARISESIEFIGTSLNNVEMKETFYTIQDLKQLIETGLDKLLLQTAVPFEISVDENSSMELYGDVSHIAQLLKKTVKEVMGRKDKGELKLMFSTKKSTYATVLLISLLDRQTSYTAEEIEGIRSIFENSEIQDFSDNSEYGLFLSMENHFLRRSGGSISMKIENDNLLVSVKIPQLGR